MSYETNQPSITPIMMELTNDENSSMEYNCDDVNELIIHYVRNRPDLWDFRNKQYKDNVVKKKLWCEVAKELDVTDDFVKKRWRNLRDRYIKEKKKSVTKSGQAPLHFSPWPLLASLSFWSDVVEPRQTVTNCQSFGIERPPAVDTFSPAPLEMFESEEYHNVYNDTQEEFQVDNMRDTDTRQTGQTESSSPYLSMRSHPNNASARPNFSLPRPPRPLSRTPSISPHSECSSPRPWNASHSRSSASPCPQTPVSCPVGSFSRQNQTQPVKRAKRQLSETHTDAVDEAILSLVEKRTSTDTMNSDDLFYLSIARDSQHLSVTAKLRLKTLVLQALSQVVAEEQNKL